MVLELLLNTQIICMIFINILKNTIQIKNVKHFVFDDVIADMLSNPIVTDLLIRGRKLNISLVFITQSCFAVQKKY